MGRGISIAGRKVNDGVDFYQTPKNAILSLLKNVEFSKEILEPCSGNGAISKVLESEGFDVTSSDIRVDEDVYGKKGENFLKYTGRNYDNIITNPPYKIAQKIIEKSLEISNEKVAMLLKLTFLESRKRYNFFKNYPPKEIWVFSRRVTMYPEGMDKPKNNGTITYAWFIWEKGYEELPMVNWIY